MPLAQWEWYTLLHGGFHAGARSRAFLNTCSSRNNELSCTVKKTDKQSQYSWKLLCAAWLSSEYHALPVSVWQCGAVSPCHSSRISCVNSCRKFFIKNSQNQKLILHMREDRECNTTVRLGVCRRLPKRSNLFITFYLLLFLNLYFNEINPIERIKKIPLPYSDDIVLLSWTNSSNRQLIGSAI